MYFAKLSPSSGFNWAELSFISQFLTGRSIKIAMFGLYHSRLAQMEHDFIFVVVNERRPK